MIFNTQLWDDFYKGNLRIYCRNSSDAELVRETLEEVYPFGDYCFVRGYDTKNYPYVMHRCNDHFCMSTIHEVDKVIEALDFVNQIRWKDEKLSCDVSLEELL